MSGLDRLKESFRSAPVVRFGDYHYFVHPVTDGVPMMDPTLLQEVVDAIDAVGDFDCDLLVTPEAMGIHLTVPLSLKRGIPYTVVRKRKYTLPGEVSVSQVTGYSRKEMFINGIESGMRVTIIDDVISTGGTLRAIVQAIKGLGAEVVDVIVVVEKTDSKAELEAELGVSIKTLVKVQVVDGRVHVT